MLCLVAEKVEKLGSGQKLFNNVKFESKRNVSKLEKLGMLDSIAIALFGF